MRTLVVATLNAGKIRELELLLQGVVAQVLPIGSFPGIPDVDEDGATFADNAVKKARVAALATGLPALADDSGLVVDALCGRPGVYSARFAGADADDTANNRKLLTDMADSPFSERTAAFHCVLAFCLPNGACETFEGRLPGIILEEPQGEEGFGYDPLFMVPEYGQTLAQLSIEIKNKISHRGKALEEFKRYLEKVGEKMLQ